MSELTLYRRLRDRLAELYLDKDEALRLVMGVKIPPRLVKFSDRAVDNWSNILQEADKQGLLVDLIEEALEERPNKNDEILRDVLNALKAGEKIFPWDTWEDESGFVPAQSALITELQRNFVGREEYIDWIEQCLANKEGPKYIVITAPAGYGKSALMAALVRQHEDYVYHFIRAEDQNHTATAFLANLCGQLSACMGKSRSYAGVELGKLEEEYERLKLQLKIDPNNGIRQIVILIDGLDEGEREGFNSILKPKYFRTSSASLRFILTYRSGSIDLATELNLREYEEKMLVGLSMNDIASLFKHLNRHDLADDSQLANQIIAKTQGEPFYLRFLVEDLCEERGVVKLPTDLPQDAKIYIAKQIRDILGLKLLTLIPAEVREFFSGQIALRAAKQLLQVLAVAQDWLTRAQLLQILKGEDASLIDCLIEAFRRYFVTDRPKDPSDVLQEQYLITPLKLKEAVQNAFSREDLLVAEESLLRFCREWTKTANQPYAFNYLTHHQVVLGRYDELLETLDQPFLRAKVAALNATHVVTIDIQRGLRECVERSDHLKIIRMLLLLAQTEKIIHERAFFGGIVIEANRGLYDIALASTRAINDIDMRFCQLLLIAEAAARNGDRRYLVQTLDEAFGLEIRGDRLLKEEVKDLLYQLIVQYRETERALALANKVDDRHNAWLKQWCIEKSCIALIDRDTDYAIELLNQLDHSWFFLCQQLVLRVMKQKPEVAYKLLMQVEQRADIAKDSPELLWVASVLRQTDPQAAEAIIRRVLENLENQDLEEDRQWGIWINHATMELAHFSLIDAIDLALNKCPYIDDSIQAITGRFHTKYGTLAYILKTANESRIRIPTDLLQAIYDSVQPEHRPKYPAMWEDVLCELVLQFAAQPDIRWAKQASELIVSISLRAKVALSLARRKPAEIIIDEVDALLALNDPPDSDLLEEFNGLYQERPELALQILRTLKDHHLMFFELANSILQVQKSLDQELMGRCLEVLSSIPSRENVSHYLRLAQTVARHGIESARIITQQALSIISTFADVGHQVLELRRIAEAANNMGFADVAAQAVRSEIEMRQKFLNINNRNFEELARFILHNKLVVSDEILIVLLSKIRNPYTTGKVVAYLSKGDVYVDAQLAMSRLDLEGKIFPSLIGATLKASIVDNARHFLDVFPAPRQALLLTQIAEVEFNSGDILSAEKDLRSAWDKLEKEQIPTDLPKKQRLKIEDGLDKGRFRILELVSRFDQKSAITLSEQLTLWHQILILVISASRMKNDAAEALRVFQHAHDIAATIDDANNRFYAKWNVYSYSVESHPKFAWDCIVDIIGEVGRLKQPRHMVLGYLTLIEKDDQITRHFIDQFWAGFTGSLNLVNWTLPDEEEILAGLKRITDIAILRQACMHTTDALLNHRDLLYSDHSKEIAQLALILARAGLRKDAISLLEICDRIWNAAAHQNQHFRGLAYQVCASRWLKRDDTNKQLTSVLQTFGRELASDGSLAYSVAQAIQILGHEYPRIADDYNAWKIIIDLCNNLGLQERSKIFISLLDNAAEAQAFDKAISLLTLIPLPEYQAEAVRRLSKELRSHITLELDTLQKSIWYRVFDAAGHSVDSLLSCVQAWCEMYLALQPSSESVAAAIDAVLRECEFVQKS